MGRPRHEFSDEEQDYFSLDIFSHNEYTDEVSPTYNHSYAETEHSSEKLSQSWSIYNDHL